MIKTFEQILEFKHYSEWRKGQGFDTKLDYACTKVLKKLNSVCINKWNGLIADIEVDHASVDEKGNLITENNTYLFTPEKTKKMREVKMYLLNEWEQKEFEFENHICTEIPEGLSEEEKDILTGFVI